MALYKAYQQNKTTPTASATAPASTAATTSGSIIENASNAAPAAASTSSATTSYGGIGNPYNEILYSKKQYDSGNKLWAAKNAQQYYSQLDPKEAALIQGMNTSQLESYLSGKNGQGAASSGSSGSADTSISDWIKQMYEGQYQSELQALQKSRETALQGLNSIETGARQSAQQNRNLSDASTQQSAQRLRKIMAEQGLLSSGDNVSANVALQAAGQNNLNAINQSEANTLQDVAERRATINNNSAADEQALLAEVNAARANALVNNAYQEANLTGTLNGQRTLAGTASDLNAQNQSWSQQFQQQQFAYQQARDQIADSQWKAQFDEDTRRYGLDYALNRQVSLGNLSLQQAQLAQSRANSSADNARQDTNANYSRLMDIWQLTGKAPAGLEAYGIQAGAPLATSSSSKSSSSSYDYRTDPGFAQDIQHINSIDPDQALAEIQSNAQTFIGAYGYDGYQALLKAAGG